jgi:multicomponent K+:H+ antiporter subunit F
MLSVVVSLALLMVAAAMALNLWRAVVGPDLVDRIIALDTLTINAIGLVLLLDIALGTLVYFEAALVLAMMGFVGTVALSKFVLGGDIIE